jgi:hypothetical protein
MALLPAAFLAFWLYGWFGGVRVAYQAAARGDSPTSARIFLIFWGIGWIAGGLIALYFVIALLFRLSDETIMLERGKLIWNPAYPLLSRFIHGEGLAFFKSLLTLRRGRQLTLLAHEVRSIDIVEVPDTEGGEPSEHLVVRHGRTQYEFGVDLDEPDRAWLCQVLESWKKV